MNECIGSIKQMNIQFLLRKDELVKLQHIAVRVNFIIYNWLYKIMILF